jgi:hypothetical protein
LYASWKDKDYIYLVLEWAPEVCMVNFQHHDAQSCCIKE